MAAVPAMLERDFQAQVVELAKLFGWRIAHFRPAPSAKGWRTPMIGHPGWPDLVLLRPPRLILAELKSTSKVRPEQQEWLDQLGQVPGVESHVWRPADLDLIVDLLRPNRTREEAL